MLQHASESEASGRTNDDALLVCETPTGFLLAVADGAGGLSGGRVAADTSLHVLQQKLAMCPIELNLTQVLYDIDRVVHEKEGAGETTLVVCVVSGNEVKGASVGDSGAWLFAPDLLDLTAHQHRKPLLGSGSSIPVAFGPLPFEGTLLLASDGLLKYSPLASIEAVVSGPSLARIPERLLNSARMRNGDLQDDTTAVVARRT